MLPLVRFFKYLWNSSRGLDIVLVIIFCLMALSSIMGHK